MVDWLRRLIWDIERRFIQRSVRQHFGKTVPYVKFVEPPALGSHVVVVYDLPFGDAEATVRQVLVDGHEVSKEDYSVIK